MGDNIYNESMKDKFTLSPFQKYAKYGRFPWKFFIGCILVYLTSAQVIFISQYYGYNNPAQIQQFVELFLNHEDTQDNSRAYLTLQDFQSGLNDTLNTLFEINDHTFQETTILGQPYLEVNYDYPYDAYLNNMSFQFNITLGESITQPFDLEDVQAIKQFWSEAYGLSLFINKIQVRKVSKTICWDVVIKYTYTDYGYITAKQFATGGLCSEINNKQVDSVQGSLFGNNPTGYDNLFLQLMCFTFALVDLILGIKYIYEVIEMYTNTIYKQNKLRKAKVPEYKLLKNKNLTTLKIILSEQKPWDQLTLNEKLLFFDLFLPLRIVGNLFQIIASAILITEGFIRVNSLSAYDELFVGIGCFFAWFAMVKYLDYYEELHLIASVLESSIIPLLMSILNFLPVFFAYVFLGMCLFCDSHNFSSLQSAIVSLLALIYGDSVSDITRNSSRDVSMEVAMLFMCSYILLFIFAVNNIMVALIKEQLDIRKDLILTEKELMNQLDINQSKLFRQDTGMLSSKKQMTSSQIQSGKKENQSQISLRSIAKLAVMMNRSSDPVTKKQIEHDWKKVSKEEMQHNYLYNYLTQNIGEVRSMLGQIERELWADVDTLQLSQSEKKEIISYYCSILIKLHQRLRETYNKTNQMEQEWNAFQ